MRNRIAILWVLTSVLTMVTYFSALDSLEAQVKEQSKQVGLSHD